MAVITPADLLVPVSLGLLGWGLALPTFGRPTAARTSQPYAVVLGTAQDGGLPQVGCDEAPCRRARRRAGARRLVASLLVVDPRTGGRWLIDATPDFREQVAVAERHPATRVDEGPRPPLFEGIFLTHAHVGHYTGLVHLGREAYGARGTPLHVSSRMAAFLSENGPWDLLVRAGHVRLEEFRAGEPVTLGENLSVTPVAVPHRDEYSDTHGFVVRGPTRSLLYLPDIDKWGRWTERIEDVLSGVDVALLDGTFFADGEVAGRAMSEIPHPFIVESLERFAAMPEAERAKVVFTHLNHTNPAADGRSAAARRVRRAGMAIAEDGQVLPL